MPCCVRSRSLATLTLVKRACALLCASSCDVCALKASLSSADEAPFLPVRDERSMVE
jgi:hypothetical protein